MNKLILLLLVLVLGTGTVLSQEMVLDPAKSVNTQIETDQAGANPADVYVAESGKIYQFDATLQVDFDLVIEGESSDWIYNQAEPPVFVPIPDAAGELYPFIQITEGGSLTLENVLCSGMNASEGDILSGFIRDFGATKIILDNCSFSDIQNYVMEVNSAPDIVSITNCIMINGLRRSSSPWGGHLGRFNVPPAELIIENNTYVNSGRLLGNGGNFYSSTIIENHNSWLNPQANAQELHWKQALMANNIFYNWSWLGYTPADVVYTQCITTFETFAGLELDSVSVYFGRNLLYSDPAIKEYYDTELLAGGAEVSPYYCWNLDVDSTILVDDNFTIGKNYGDFDPEFTTGPGNLDKMLEWLSYRYIGTGGWPDWRVTSPVTFDGGGQPVINWPPAFDLSYSNTYLQTASTDGLPLGDLNWFPDEKATYLANKDAYIAALQDSMTNATSIYVAGDSSTVFIRPRDVEGTIHVYPIKLNFGNVALGESKTDSISFSNSANDTLHINNISITGDTASVFSADTSTFSIAPGGKRKVVITFTPELEITYNASITVNSDSGNVNVALKGVGYVRRPIISIASDSVLFGLVPQGTTANDSIAISNIGSDTLHINSLSISGTDTSIFSIDTTTFTLSPGDSQFVKVMFVPDSSRTFNASLDIGSDGGNVNIGLEGIGYVPQPIIFVTPDSLNFGNVQQGAAASDSTAIFNIGSDTLHIESLSISGNDYSMFMIDTTTFSLSPGDSQFVKITFMPDSSGTFTASLNISSDGGDENIGLSGTGNIIDAINNDDSNIPNKYSLAQNYPNPFNPNTSIRFSLPRASDVLLEIYNSIGQKIKTLVQGKMAAGWHEVNFDASQLASGIYYYRIHAGDFIQVKKMLLMK